jgi:hypothetical protein
MDASGFGVPFRAASCCSRAFDSKYSSHAAASCIKKRSTLMSYRLADINDEFHRLTTENYKQPALTQQNKTKNYDYEQSYPDSRPLRSGHECRN